jgi:hypothetical protein
VRAANRRARVLVTADGRHLRDPLVAVRALAAGGYSPRLAVSCGTSIAESSRYCEGRVSVPPCDDPDYRAVVEEEVRRGGYFTVLPASEAALLALGEKSELVDKVKLAERGQAVGISAPPSRLVSTQQELRDASGEFSFPVIVKPAVHRYNAIRIDSPRDLERVPLRDGRLIVQPWLSDLNAISGVMWRGRLVAAVHERWLRIWRYHAGVASAAVTIAPDVEREERMTRLLDGFEGIFHAQFAGPYLLDLNLRIHTSHPMAVAAGANLATTYCRLLEGKDVPDVRARPGVRYRWLEGDLRHLGRAVREKDMSFGAALRELRPRRGTAHSTESITDPKPMLSRASYIVRMLVREGLGREQRESRLSPDNARGIRQAEEG